MKLRLAPLLSLAALATLAAVGVLAAPSAFARIVVDDTVPEAGADQPGIAVPGPRDSGSADQPAAAAQPDSLLFLNKDQLHGGLTGIDAAGAHWKSPEAAAPIVFRLQNLAEVKFGSAPPEAAKKGGQRVGLINRDVLPGDIVSLDDKTLTLQTGYAGQLAIPRARLRQIVPNNSAAQELYDGPTGMEGWTVGNMGGGRSWAFRNGALVGTSYGTIGRDVKLPDLSSISFDADLRGNGQLSVSIYSDRADNFGNCYMLQFNPNFAELQRYSRNGGSNDLGGGIPLRNMMRRDKIRVELRTSKPKKSIWLFINDKMIKQWTDTADFNGQGGCLLFSCQPGSSVKISNIKVAAWDGTLESDHSEVKNNGEDTVKLANEDKVSGHVKGIRNGKLKFASAYADLEIPLERVEAIDLASGSAPAPKADPGDVRVTLPDNGTVTMKLLSWDEKACQGSSPNFGQAAFAPKSFTRIQFNLPSQPSGDDDSEADEFPPDSGAGGG